MTQLSQMRLQLDALEDRLLLRVNTRDRAEYRLWLTRRYVKVLWPVLVKLAESNPDVQLQPQPETRAAVLSFQHENALRKADFKTVYREDAVSLPLGERPTLLARVGVKQAPDGRRILCLDPLQGVGIELSLGDGMLHSFCKLLAETVQKAGWDLDLRLVRPQPLAGPAAHAIN